MRPNDIVQIVQRFKEAFSSRGLVFRRYRESADRQLCDCVVVKRTLNFYESQYDSCEPIS